MKRGKKDLLAGLPGLKQVEGRLPYAFDLYWDIKWAEDLPKDNPVVNELLAQEGYDVRAWLAGPQGRKGGT